MVNLQSRTVFPEDEFSSGDESSYEALEAKRATVYEAVQGKVTQSGFHSTKAAEQKRANIRLRPDEVLYKKPNAPPRYEETDHYFAHRKLPSNQELPSGDLLSALHGYVSQLYHRTQEDGMPEPWKSMDETALIALGILLEETVKETLGETGDLALLEAERSEEEDAFKDHDMQAQMRKDELMEHMKKLRQDRAREETG